MQHVKIGNRMSVLMITISFLLFGVRYAVACEYPGCDSPGGGQRGPHGALNMDAQKALLEKLLPKHDVTQPPP